MLNVRLIQCGGSSAAERGVDIGRFGRATGRTPPETEKTPPDGVRRGLVCVTHIFHLDQMILV